MPFKKYISFHEEDMKALVGCTITDIKLEALTDGSILPVLRLEDNEGHTIDLTVWGDEEQNFPGCIIMFGQESHNGL